ncbi:MAG: T9SS type A sorting domain-containing protein [Balneolales bacterium]
MKIQAFQYSIIVIVFIIFPFLVNAQSVTVLDEDFSGGTLPSGWSQTNMEFSTVAGGYAGFPLITSELTTPVLDITGLANVQLTFRVAQLNSGEPGPVSIHFSIDEGLTWSIHTFDSPIPTSGKYILSGPTLITAGGEETLQIKISRPQSPSGKRITDVKLTGSSNPFILAESVSMTAFEYIQESGPSAARATTINSYNIEDYITVTGSENYEISLDNENFSAVESYYNDSQSAQKIIYIRLKEGLPSQLYNEIISISGGNAEDVFISLSGSVKPILSTDGYTEEFNTFVNFKTLPAGWSSSDSTYIGTWGQDIGFGLLGNSNVLGYEILGDPFIATLTLTNKTGGNLENLNISYMGMVEQLDHRRSPEWTVEVNGVENDALFYTTSAGVDSWMQTSISNLSIPEGQDFTISWSSIKMNNGTGKSRQIGIGKVSVLAYRGDQVYQTMLTGAEGFRMMTAPTFTTHKNLLTPVWTQGIENGDVLFGDPNVWTWDKTLAGEEKSNWEPLSDLDTQLTAGNGILVYVFKNDNGPNESGTFPKIITASGAENSLPLDLAASKLAGGFTLLGNPSALPLSWNDITRHGVDDVVYIWDPNAETTGAWLTKSLVAGNLVDGIIRPFQGFFIRTSSDSEDPKLVITEQAQNKGGTYYGKQTQEDFPLVMRLQLDGEELSNSAWLHFSETGFSGNDSGDALKLQPLSTEYVIMATRREDNVLLDINHLPIIEEPIGIPLALNTTSSGTFVLSATRMDLPPSWNVMITDNKTGETVKLDTLTNYKIQLNSNEMISASKKITTSEILMADIGENSDRFTLTINPGKLTGIRPESLLPSKLVLRQNYPNPFNPTTNITYELPDYAIVHLAVYDLLGREIATLVSETKPAGIHQVNWNAHAASSGMYIYRLEADGQSLVGKMTVIK